MVEAGPRYNLGLASEIEFYARELAREPALPFIAPFTLSVVATWAIATRLTPVSGCVDRIEKLKVCEGRSVPGVPRTAALEWRERADEEGTGGVAPEWVVRTIRLAGNRADVRQRGWFDANDIFDKISEALSLLSETEEQGLRELLDRARDDYAEMVHVTVCQAVLGGTEPFERLSRDYVANVRAYVFHETIAGQPGGPRREPDEALMRGVEEQIEVSEGRKDDYRCLLMAEIGAFALDGMNFSYRSDARLRRALERKVFSDLRLGDTLRRLATADKDEQTVDEMNTVKQRLIREFGYDDVTAAYAIGWVAGASEGAGVVPCG